MTNGTHKNTQEQLEEEDELLQSVHSLPESTKKSHR